MAASQGELDYDLGMGKAVTLFSMGRYGEALQMAQTTGNLEQHAVLVYAAAREISLSLQALTVADLPEDERTRWIETYATAAIALLRKAAANGYFSDQATVEFLNQDSYLDMIRERKDFQAFVKELR